MREERTGCVLVTALFQQDAEIECGVIVAPLGPPPKGCHRPDPVAML